MRDHRTTHELVISTVGVVIPARNEQADIERCLNAVEVAVGHLRNNSADPPDVRVVVVLDCCTDGTAVLADRPGVECVAVDAGCVGMARAAGVAHLMAGAARPEQIWLANTDADSTVPPDWLLGMVSAARRGADVVLGTVIPDTGLEHLALRAWHDRHDLRAGHGYVHGANFGIRGNVYASLGGWPALCTGEDQYLAGRALASPSVHVVRTASIPVHTSSRLTGRAPDGFARYLRGLSLTPDEASCPAEIS